MATPNTEVAAQERPSGSFATVKHDGFEISSNTGTADDMRAELGIVKPGEPVIDGDDAPTELPTRAKSARDNPQARKQSIQSQIDADVARGKTAKSEADAEEARLTKLREEAKTYQPRPAAQPQQQPVQQPPQSAPKPKDYDGTDPADPEPTVEQFAQAPDPYTASLHARMDWAARKEARKLVAQRDSQMQQQQAEVVYGRRLATLTDKFKAHEAIDKDFKTKIDPEVAAALQWSTPAAVGTPLGDLVMDSPNPIELMIHFSQHKSEFQRISGLHPLMQAMELGEIRGRLAVAATPAPAPRPKPVSAAKAPIKPLGGSPAPAADDTPDEDLTDEQHEARYAKTRRQYR